MGPLGGRPEPVIGALSSSHSGLPRSNVPSNRSVAPPRPCGLSLVLHRRTGVSLAPRCARHPANRAPRHRIRMGYLLKSCLLRSRRPVPGEPGSCLLISRPSDRSGAGSPLAPLRRALPVRDPTQFGFSERHRPKPLTSLSFPPKRIGFRTGKGHLSTTLRRCGQPVSCLGRGRR